MGDIVDLENDWSNPRCEHVKLGVIIINLIGAPSSFIILVISIFKMLKNKKRIPFLTMIILFIFLYEIMNSISKMLQLLKYAFEDTRIIRQNNRIETPRGQICQIQIFTSIFSDYGCLLGTLLLSIRCYDIIKNKRRCSDSKKVKIISIVFITAIPFILSMTFLMIDKMVTIDSFAFKYDLRDRCNYWCWVEHNISIALYSSYVLIVALILYYFCLTYNYLKKSFKNMLEKSIVLIANTEDEKINNKDNEKINEKRYMSEEDNKRINDLRAMSIKVTIYPAVTFIIWILSFIYRLADDIALREVDDNDDDSGLAEKKYFSEHPGLQGFVETNLLFHTFLSAFRGIFYGYAFIMFEEKAFGYIFKDCCYKCKCCQILDINTFESDENNKDDKINSSSSSSMTDTLGKDNNEEIQFRKSSGSDYGRPTGDLNTSDYRYND